MAMEKGRGAQIRDPISVETKIGMEAKAVPPQPKSRRTSGKKIAVKPLCKPGVWLLAVAMMLAAADAAQAQSGLVPFYHQRLAPGTIGQLQNMKGRGIPGYFQPVQIVPPEGTKVAAVVQGAFADDLPAPQTFGCLIGAVYRFRITEIPLQPGAELYPTVEVIDRTYPPAGLELKYPIPVHLTAEELQYALEGKFVTRVIYLEDPDVAIPNAYEPGFQPYFELPPGEDPVITANQLGRPVAILRLGSRRPTEVEIAGEFTYQSPPIRLFELVPTPIDPAMPPHGPVPHGPPHPGPAPLVPPTGVPFSAQHPGAAAPSAWPTSQR